MLAKVGNSKTEDDLEDADDCDINDTFGGLTDMNQMNELIVQLQQ